MKILKISSIRNNHIWFSSLASLFFISLFILDYKSHNEESRDIQNPRKSQILKELTKLEEFEGIEPEECLLTRPFINSMVERKVLFLFRTLTFRPIRTYLYKACIHWHSRVWVYKERRRMGDEDSEHGHHGNAEVPSSYLPRYKSQENAPNLTKFFIQVRFISFSRHRSQPRYVHRGGGCPEQDRSGCGRWPVQPGLHQEVPRPGGEHWEC